MVEHETGAGNLDRVYYIPHQAIFRDNSSTTKIRIVFDASSHECNKSLNDNLESGPNLNPDLVTTLTPELLNLSRFISASKLN